MSKKIFHSSPASSVSPSRILHVDPSERPGARKRKAKEFVEGEVGKGKERRNNRRKVKAEARANRETSRNERRMQERPVTGIDFKEGDLVYHFKSPDTLMLVTGVVKWSAHGTYVECMLGVELLQHKALHLRKAED